MNDTEYVSHRKAQIEEFRVAISAAIEDARRLRSSAPIWKTFREFGHDHVVDFGDVHAAINIAQAIDGWSS